MKILTKIWGTALLAILLMAIAPAKSFAQDGGQYISTQEFYDQLSPYGTWVYDNKYGDVWLPDVEQDFRPYVTNGHWVYTSYGNTWVSDYDWGWATFHYGRWTYDDYYGWEWVPGSEWAPAWVDWKDGDGYYGWAPMTPDMRFDATYGNDYFNDYSVPDTYWSFAPYAYINYPNVYNYCVPYARVHTLYGHANFIRNTYNYNNRVYVTGPRRDEIQRHTGRPVRLYTINNIDRPSRNTFNRNSVNFYRPDVRTDRGARPQRAIDGAAYRQQNPTQRIGGNDRRAGVVTQRENASKLANEARSNNSRFVRTDNNRTGIVNPQLNNNRVNPTNTQNGQPSGGSGRFNRRPGDVNSVAQPGQPVRSERQTGLSKDLNNQTQQSEQQRQARDQQRQQMQAQRQQQAVQQNQQAEQARQQQVQQAQQRQQQAPPVSDQQIQQVQQRQQQTEQQRQQAAQNDLQRKQEQQLRAQQRQQQQQQARQQQSDQQRQQQNQQQQQVRQQQQQAREQQRQQMATQQSDQQRQQQQQVREQQKQQQEQARQQQADQQRLQQQQAKQQQADQQRQQQQQARDQQRQQQDQARQQQQQQRQQQEQQRQQQQRQQEQQRPPRP